MVAIGVVGLEPEIGGSIGAVKRLREGFLGGRDLKSSEEGSPNSEVVVLNRFDATALTWLRSR